MKIFVAYSKSGIHSGQALADILREELSPLHEVDDGRANELANLQAAGDEFDYVVNIGSTANMEGLILNSPTAISLSSHKLNARRHFQKQAISAPQLWEDSIDIPDEAFPVIARTTHHARGEGLWFCNSRAEANKASEGYCGVQKKLITTKKGNRVWRDRPVHSEPATHFIKYINNTREFRVHVLAPRADLRDLVASNYLILKLSEKVPSDTVTSDVVKNKEQGWVFAFPKDTESLVLEKIRQLAKEAIASLGLHFGAVDVVYSLDDNQVYVLEVNSAPCLTDDQANTLDKYVWGIKTLVGLIHPPEKKAKLWSIPSFVNQKVYSSLLERLGV